MKLLAYILEVPVSETPAILVEVFRGFLIPSWITSMLA
jgi:hypothetical protein